MKKVWKRVIAMLLVVVMVSGGMHVYAENCNHNYELTQAIPVACTTDGQNNYTCSKCGMTKTEIIPAIGHDYECKKTPATCTDNGFTTYTCSRCGGSYTNPGDAALGHNWVKNGNGSEVCSRCGIIKSNQSTSYQVGDILSYGSYPQTEVKDSSLIAVLNAQSGTWQSYGYYSGTGEFADGQMIAKDYMRYKDVTYSGSKYRAVTFDSYRPRYTGYTSSASYSYQDWNGYTTGNVYWFKYEPLQWRLLDASTGFVMCCTLIDSQPYNNYILLSGSESWGDAGKTYYASNYKYSSIRKWLNEDFCDTAFTASQKLDILTSTLNNDCWYTLDGYSGHEEYDAPSTSDKVFLLSYDEVTNSNYGFASDSEEFDISRQLMGSDYAKCQGLWVADHDTMDDVCSNWRLRSPGLGSVDACIVRDDGDCGYLFTFGTSAGVCPALRLNLDSLIDEPQTYFTVTYTINGEYYSEQQVLSGETIAPPSYTVPEGYYFSGWNCSGTVSGNLTLDATLSKQSIDEEYIVYYDDKVAGTEKTIISSHPLDYYILNSSSVEYNSELSLLLAGFSDNAYDLTRLNDSLESHGFESLKTYNYGSDYDPNIDIWVAYAFATKTMSNGQKLVLVTIRGTNGGSLTKGEWAGNLQYKDFDNPIYTGPHPNFNQCSNSIYAELRAYLAEQKLFDYSDMYYAITGHSKGAGVANLLSVKLLNNGVPEQKLFNYNFACPDVALQNWNNVYQPNCIHNICNVKDPVTHIPGEIQKAVNNAEYGIVSIIATAGKKWDKYGSTLWFQRAGDDGWWDLRFGTSDHAHEISMYIEFLLKNRGMGDPFELFAKGLEALSSASSMVDLTIVKCPVDITIYDRENHAVATVVNDEVFYYCPDSSIVVYVQEGKKCILSFSDELFKTVINATDSGTMDVISERVNPSTGTIDEETTFESIQLYKGKSFVFDNQSDGTVSEKKLFVTDKTGKKTAEVLSDGTEKPISTPSQRSLVLHSNKEISGETGQRVSLVLQIEHNPGIAALNLTVSYDHDLLTLEGVSGNNSWMGGYSTSGLLGNGDLLMNWEDGISPQNNTYTGQIATVSFRLKKDFEKTTVVITGKGYNVDIQSVSVDGCSCQVINTSHNMSDVWTYEIIQGYAYITKCNALPEDKRVTIPDTLDGYPVAMWYFDAFIQYSDFELVIPNSFPENWIQAIVETEGQQPDFEYLRILYNYALADCAVNAFTVLPGNAYLQSINGVLYNKDMSALIKYPVCCKAKSYELPATIDIYASCASWYAGFYPFYCQDTLTGASDLTIHIGAKQLQRVYDNNCNRYSSDDERIKHTLADIVGFGVGTATICTDWNNEIVDLDPASYVFTVQDFNAPKASIPSLERCGGNTSFTLSVCNMPTKTQYYVGESFDQSGLALTATYSDGSTKTITSGFTCTGFSSATNGAKTITVSYEGKTTTFVVFVENKPIITIHNYTANKTVDYRTTITFSVDEIQNPVPDAQVYWFINGQNQGASDTYTEREATTGFTVQAKYIRAGSVLAESEVETVKVNNGFFARLVAFFRGLFGRLPKIVQAYVGAKERGE